MIRELVKTLNSHNWMNHLMMTMMRDCSYHPLLDLLRFGCSPCSHLRVYVGSNDGFVGSAVGNDVRDVLRMSSMNWFDVGEVENSVTYFEYVLTFHFFPLFCLENTGFR